MILAFAKPTIAQYQSYYSQYIFSGLIINPAYAGSQDALNVSAVYRNQWAGLEGAPKNFSIAGHTPLKNKKTNIGVVLSNETFGITSKISAGIAYAYRIKLKENDLSFGLQAGSDFLRNDWTLIKTTDANDPNFIPQIENKSALTFGAGVYYTAKNLYAGLSFPSLYKTNSKGAFSPAAANLYSGFLLRVSDGLVVKPSVLIKYINNSALQYDVTGTFYFSKIFGLGAGYRSSDAAYGFLDLKITDQFNLGYSYDFTTSNLKNYSSGSHEILLRYLFKYNVNSKSVRYF